MTTQTTEFFDTLAKILLRCWIFGVMILLFWFVALMLAGGLIYGVHGSMFFLTQHEFGVIHYCGMGLLKFVVGVFFFLPWLSIRLVLKKAKA